MHDAVEDRFGPTGAVRRPAGARERQRRTPGVHIHRAVAGLAENLLGREVSGRAEHHAAARDGREVGHDGKSQIDHVRLTGEDQHVARGQVPVHHTGRMQGSQREGHAQAEPNQPELGERPGLRDQLVEPLPGDEPRDDPGCDGRRVTAEDLDEVRTAYALQHLELTPEPATSLRVDAAVPQHLDCDHPVIRGDSEEDGAHAALAETTQEPVRPDEAGITRPQALDRHRHPSVLGPSRAESARRPRETTSGRFDRSWRRSVSAVVLHGQPRPEARLGRSAALQQAYDAVAVRPPGLEQRDHAGIVERSADQRPADEL